MFIFTFIAYMSLFIAIVATIFAIKGYHRHYWIAAVCIYIFSFLAGFSIGQLTVGFTFILIALAIGYTFGWIKTTIQVLTFTGIGAGIGLVIVLYAGKWKFLPFFPLMKLLS